MSVKAKLASSDCFDVLIVGGGMVGATLACALGNLDLRIGVIEARAPSGDITLAEDTPFEPRVSALTQASRNLLDNIGAWQFIRQYRHSPFERMSVWDAEGTGKIEFNAPELGQLTLGYIIENAITVAGLFQRLAMLEKVEVLAPASIKSLTASTENKRQVVLQDGRILNATLVVGADGAQSEVRQQAGIEIAEKDYRQSAIVTTVKTELPHQATAWQCFLATGPLAFLPLRTNRGDDHYCSIVWSVDEQQAKLLLALNDDEFVYSLGRAFEHRLGLIESVDQRFLFPLRRRHATSYIKPGLALVGDAAHTIHPLAGQGVNLGLLDAAVLAEEITRAVQRGLPLSEQSFLSRYQRRRVADNMLMMNAMTGFKQLFGQRDPVIRWLRNTGMSLVDQMGPVKNHFAAHAMGLAGDLPALTKPRVSGT